MKNSVFSQSARSNDFAGPAFGKAPKPNLKRTHHVVLFCVLIVALLSYNTISAQSFRKTTKQIDQYYSDPVKEGDFVLTMANFTVDKEALSDREYGAVLLGGLALSYEKARNNENIAVVVMNSKNEIFMLYVKKAYFRDFINGKITQWELLNKMLTLTVNGNKSNELTGQKIY
jgi:hypothetical protein